MCEICSNLTIKTHEYSSVSIVDLEQINISRIIGFQNCDVIK